VPWAVGACAHSLRWGPYIAANSEYSVLTLQCDPAVTTPTLAILSVTCAPRAQHPRPAPAYAAPRRALR
jgi:hypothetical protein